MTNQETIEMPLENGTATSLLKNDILIPLRNVTVGAMATNDPRMAEIFKKWGIDFCCGGHKTLGEACAEASVDQASVEHDLNHITQTPYRADHKYSEWSLDFLADYVYNIHHQYVRINAQVIESLALKVASRHGAQHPELNSLNDNIKSFLEDMLLHLEKEEQVVFPYIRTIVACKKNGTALPSAISSIRSPIQVMEEEHQIAGDELRFFRSLTNNYTLPFDACNSYKLLFDKMLAFEEDLFQHIHLENNILFPKALELEKEVLNQLS